MTKHERPMRSPRRPIVWASSLGFPLGSVIGISSFVWQIRHDARSDKNIHERNLKKEQPAEPHKLIVTEAWQGKTHPNETKQEHRHFRKKRSDIEQASHNAAPARGGSVDKRPAKTAMPRWKGKMPT